MGMWNGNGNGVSRAFLPAFDTCMQEHPYAKCKLSDGRVRAGV